MTSLPVMVSALKLAARCLHREEKQYDVGDVVGADVVDVAVVGVVANCGEKEETS